MAPGGKDVDVFRDTPVRYLGYSNEVGEAVRSLVPVSLVRLSYALACGYVIADSIHKGNIAGEYTWPPSTDKRNKVAQAVMDTVVWQGLASVVIPGLTINRLCYFSAKFLGRVLLTVPRVTKKYVVTGIGLVAIPFIISPIDHSVDLMMNKTIRKMYHIGEVLEKEIVHHTRND